MRFLNIKSKKNVQELVIFLSSLLITTITWLFVVFRCCKKSNQKIQKSCKSAFSELSIIEKDIFNDLHRSAIDIDLFHRNNTTEWPDIQTLEANIMPPFVKDAVWEKRGHIEWSFASLNRNSNHCSLYIGKSPDPKKYGSFILYLKHIHSENNTYTIERIQKQTHAIWYKKGMFILPRELTENSLISSGWKQIRVHKKTEIPKNMDRA